MLERINGFNVGNTNGFNTQNAQLSLINLYCHIPIGDSLILLHNRINYLMMLKSLSDQLCSNVVVEVNHFRRVSKRLWRDRKSVL